MSEQTVQHEYDLTNRQDYLLFKEKELHELSCRVDNLYCMIQGNTASDFSLCTLQDIKLLLEQLEKDKRLEYIAQESKSCAGTKCEAVVTEDAAPLPLSTLKIDDMVKSETDKLEPDYCKEGIDLEEKVSRTVQFLQDYDLLEMEHDNEVYIRSVAQSTTLVMEKMCKAKAKGYNDNYGAELVNLAMFSPAFIDELDDKAFSRMLKAQLQIHHNMMISYLKRRLLVVAENRDAIRKAKANYESIKSDLANYQSKCTNDKQLHPLRQRAVQALRTTIQLTNIVHGQLLQLKHHTYSMTLIERSYSSMCCPLLLNRIPSSFIL